MFDVYPDKIRNIPVCTQCVYWEENKCKNTTEAKINDKSFSIRFRTMIRSNDTKCDGLKLK
jgi:hypothetical protein